MKQRQRVLMAPCPCCGCPTPLDCFAPTWEETPRSLCPFCWFTVCAAPDIERDEARRRTRYEMPDAA